MRFVLDQDVDARVVGLLVRSGHEAWTVSDAGMFDAPDDAISIYAGDKGAVVITHDVEFSNRRRRNPHGRHVQLGREPEAAAVLSERLDELVALLAPFNDVFAYVSKAGVETHHRWT